jgi:hypothetical protein
VGQSTQPFGIRIGHVEEAWSEAFVIGADGRIASGEIDVIGEQDKLPLL